MLTILHGAFRFGKSFSYNVILARRTLAYAMAHPGQSCVIASISWRMAVIFLPDEHLPEKGS